MRLSADKDDSGYSPAAFQAKVFLDDVELIGRCITADEEKGEVICYVRPLAEDPENRGALQRETLKGKVRIELR